MKYTVDIDKGLIFDNGNYILLSPINNIKCSYELYNNENKLLYTREDLNPMSLGDTRSVLIKQFQELYCNNREDMNVAKLMFTNGLLKFKSDLEDLFRSIISREETLKLKEEYQKKLEEEQILKEALKFYNEHPNFLIYLGSLFDWVTAGERANVMLVFLSFCSQVILKEPISVIGLGDGSSGKTFIVQTALGALPEKYVLNEKKATLASMFRRSQDDTHYYDGKIVNLGDLGDDEDKKEQAKVLALLKELQTDGTLEKPVVIGSGDDMHTHGLLLEGHPCLTYTTVPNKDFDGQEKSRAVFFKPRIDNRSCYEKMLRCIEWVGGVSYNNQAKYEEIICERIPFVVEYLRERAEDLQIINPYLNVVQQFIGDSDYYKRDINKYNNILKVISIFNLNNKQIYSIDGQDFIFVSKNDVQLFYTLMKPYHMSIQYNISKQATEIYEDLLENMDKYVEKSQEHLKSESLDWVEDAITVEEYKELGKTDYDNSSLYTFFRELRNEGFIKSIDKRGRSNCYCLTTDKTMDYDLDISLSHDDLDLISYEFGSEIFTVIDNDVLDEGLSIFNQDKSIRKPAWR